jgi:hypothetical protein
MSKYRIEQPDGSEILTDDLTPIELVDQYEITACIMAGCPDANGYTLHNLTTGYVTETTAVRDRIEEELAQ